MIEGTDLSNLFYFNYLNYNIGMLKEEDDISKIKTQILNVPEIIDINIEDKK